MLSVPGDTAARAMAADRAMSSMTKTAVDAKGLPDCIRFPSVNRFLKPVLRRYVFEKKTVFIGFSAGLGEIIRRDNLTYFNLLSYILSNVNYYLLYPAIFIYTG